MLGISLRKKFNGTFALSYCFFIALLTYKHFVKAAVGVCEQLETGAAPSRNGTLRSCTKHPFSPYRDDNNWPVQVPDSLQMELFTGT
jgi:hypothetical protein